MRGEGNSVQELHQDRGGGGGGHALASGLLTEGAGRGGLVGATTRRRRTIAPAGLLACLQQAEADGLAW